MVSAGLARGYAVSVDGDPLIWYQLSRVQAWVYDNHACTHYRLEAVSPALGNMLLSWFRTRKHMATLTPTLAGMAY
jgi:hypothetical protein